MVILMLTATSAQYNIVLQEHLAGYALGIMIQGRVFTIMARAKSEIDVAQDMETWLDLWAAI